jgi:ubiquinone/menaquinone biosynthesis C-methylase UbiE
MTDIRKAYDIWANQYDLNDNKTRDLEAISLRNTLDKIKFDSCLEIGCGTGKNTEWLLTRVKQLTAVDFSLEMLAKAKEKINAPNVEFLQADITSDWVFINKQYHLLVFSLVLEHIENLNDIFNKAAAVLVNDGYIYIGELHPFKQYTGSKARFDTADGQQVLTCFNHNISDFTQAAKSNGFKIIDIAEYFDDNNINNIPRILTLLLKKERV